MWRGTKDLLIRQHDFYVSQVMERMLSGFQDMEGQAKKHADEAFAALASGTGDGSEDLSALADQAYESGINYYSLLDELRKDLLLGALAGCFHQWEKALRDFMERELQHGISHDEASNFAWQPNIDNVFEMLEQFGWKCRSTAYYSKIDACRVIVNVHKHGKGTSLNRLLENYPEYIRSPFGNRPPPIPLPLLLDYDWLEISDEQFLDLVTSLRRFWVDFPENLFATAIQLKKRK
jgi:hypothetical protein